MFVCPAPTCTCPQFLLQLSQLLWRHLGCLRHSHAKGHDPFGTKSLKHQVLCRCAPKSPCRQVVTGSLVLGRLWLLLPVPAAHNLDEPS